MKLTLYREELSQRTTIGSLFCDGQFCCHTLEPRSIDWSKEKKEWGKTAIPEGFYRVKLCTSARYGKQMPYLLDVPQFTGIMIHPGNFASDTAGCILPGWRYYKSVFGVYDSSKAFATLMKVIAHDAMYDALGIMVTDKSCMPREFDVHPDFQKQYEQFQRIRYGKNGKP